MAPSNETRQLGAAGLGKLSFPGGNDTRVYPTKSALNQEAILRLRLRRQRQVRHLWRLGEQALFYFLREVEAGVCIPENLEIYAEIDPAFVRALGGSQFPPALHCIDGRGP